MQVLFSVCTAKLQVHTSPSKRASNWDSFKAQRASHDKFTTADQCGHTLNKDDHLVEKKNALQLRV